MRSLVQEFMSKSQMNVIGLMSGTSMDGVDLVHVEFSISRKKVKYRIVNGKTIPYPRKISEKLKNSRQLSGLELTLLDRELGRYYGQLILKFIGKSEIDLISSHGHTIFHQPENRMTLQIGSGAEIAAITGIKTICDFRSTDVALGGQGAPLVPFGDEILFGKYDYCLNLGGYSNISFRKNQKRTAFDISPCNVILNSIANEKGRSFDDKGEMASRGKCDPKLLKSLNDLKFYKSKKNKSLGNEWLEKNILPIIKKNKIKTEDKLNTIIEHIAIQISKNIENNKKGKSVLTTGGGAYNDYLVERIRFHSKARIIIPEKKLIDFKEALIFALLGYMREQNFVNTFASSTGARRNSSGGAVYFP